MPDLTPRQREVAQLAYEGLSTKQIAREMGITPKTVKCYYAQIGGRLDGRGRAHVKAIRWWAEQLMANTREAA